MDTRDTPIRVTRIFSDESGRSHFAEVEMPLSLRHVSQNVAARRASSAMRAEQVQFVSVPAAAVNGAWHPAPARQFVLILSGGLEVEVMDGARRRFQQGSVVFVENLSGEGHRNTPIGDVDTLVVFIPVPDDIQPRDWPSL